MSKFKGKGLSPEERAIFDRNEAVFSGNYLSYLRSLADPLDIEFAQLRRRFQTSYEEQGRWHCTFNHKFTNFEGLDGFRTFIEFPEVKFEIEVQDSQLTFKVYNDYLADEIREAFAKEVKAQCLQKKSFVRGLSYIDNHLGAVLKECNRCLVYIDEEVKYEDYSSELSDQEDYHDDFAISSKDQTSQKGPAPQRKKETLKEAPSQAKQRVGYVAKDAPDRLKLSTATMNLYGVTSCTLKTIVMQGHCKACNTGCNLQLTSTVPGKLEASLLCGCGRQLELVLHTSVVTLASLTLGKMTSRGLNYLMGISMSFDVTCSSCLEDFLLNAIPLTSIIDVCPHCMNRFHFKVDQVSSTVEVYVLKKQIDKPKKQKQSVGLQHGTPLPRYGTCKHYKHSFRWLRFPCCNKAYPCDDCHNETADHVAEFANRMICGYCSREQNFSSSAPCSSCKTDLSGKGKGSKRFWEGGKGCRASDQMSRKDKRKFKGK